MKILFKNTDNHYGIVSILLHWVMAILILWLIWLGYYMDLIPISLRKLKLYGWHKEYGMLVLVLVILRFAWRYVSIVPELPHYLPHWQKLAARAVHLSLYILMIIVPISGWMISTSAGLPVSFFGLFIFPEISPANETIFYYTKIIHSWTNYALIVVIILHILAALKHHFIHKDDILRRIIP